MSEKNPEPETYGIDIEDPREDDLFLEEYPQVGNDNHGVPYLPPYVSPTSLPASSEKTWRDKRLEVHRMPEVYNESQGPLLTQQISYQYYPSVQYTVQQGNQPIHGNYIDMTRVQQVTQPVPHVPNYYWVSWLVCIFCAWPCGLCAVIMSKQANAHAKRGEYLEGRANARFALYLIVASVVFGLTSFGIYIAKHFNKF